MAARPVIEGVDLFITRRVRGREFRLRPSKKTNQLIGYIVAVISKKYSISIHAICVLSDHWHLVIHDWFGHVVDFTRECHSLIARVINETYGDTESLWSSNRTDRPRLLTPADTLDRIAYTMGNPVKHGLVKNGRSWPGLRRSWPDPPKRFKRPTNFFRDIGVDKDDEGKWPEWAILEMHRPLGFEHLSDNELAIKVRKAIAATEEGFRIKRADAGKHHYLGRRKVQTEKRHARAKAPERKYRRRKTVLCADPTLEEQALEAERAWRATYAERLTRWRRGERDVVFPYGTYKMRVLHNVNVAPPP